MASFSKVIDLVLDLEGGYQNHDEDYGNYNAYDPYGELVPYKQRPGRTLQAGTNRGISATLYSGMKKREVSVAEMKAITEAEARSIYKMVYWDTIKGDEIHNQALANLIFDSKVNHGYAGVKIVQKVINYLGYSETLKVDGIVGTKTLKAINSIAPARLNNGILDAREKFYRNLANNRPGNDRFLNGWLNRLKKFPRMGNSGGHNNNNNSTPPSKSDGKGVLFFVVTLLGITFFIDK